MLYPRSHVYNIVDPSFVISKFPKVGFSGGIHSVAGKNWVIIKKGMCYRQTDRLKKKTLVSLRSKYI